MSSSTCSPCASSSESFTALECCVCYGYVKVVNRVDKCNNPHPDYLCNECYKQCHANNKGKCPSCRDTLKPYSTKNQISGYKKSIYFENCFQEFNAEYKNALNKHEQDRADGEHIMVEIVDCMLRIYGHYTTDIEKRMFVTEVIYEDGEKDTDFKPFRFIEESYTRTDDGYIYLTRGDSAKIYNVIYRDSDNDYNHLLISFDTEEELRESLEDRYNDNIYHWAGGDSLDLTISYGLSREMRRTIETNTSAMADFENLFREESLLIEHMIVTPMNMIYEAIEERYFTDILEYRHSVQTSFFSEDNMRIHANSSEEYLEHIWFSVVDESLIETAMLTDIEEVEPILNTDNLSVELGYVEE